MTLKQAAKTIGIEEYPQELDAISAKGPACDLTLIQKLQEEHDLFGEFYDEVKASAEAINADSAYCLWTKTASEYVIQGTVPQISRMPAPPADGTLVSRWLMLHILIPQIARSVSEYRQRGFSEEELQSLLSAYKKSIRVVLRGTGQSGLNKGYYTWLCLYAKARIFEAGGFEFEIRSLPASACWLQNSLTGETVAVAVKGTFHRSGIQPLGSCGYEDDEGAFTVTFTEDEESYRGHRVTDRAIEKTGSVFPKSRWKCIGKPGDPCLGMHIPAGADISQPALEKAFAVAKQIAAQRYPEHDYGHIYCNSWLLDPQLEELLGEGSRIVGFMKRFVKFPQKDGGKAALSFVFGKYTDYESLPENTGLERKLKQLYLNGGSIHAHYGIIV